jgi:hypothetical protein
LDERITHTVFTPTGTFEGFAFSSLRGSPKGGSASSLRLNVPPAAPASDAVPLAAPVAVKTPDASARSRRSAAARIGQSQRCLNLIDALSSGLAHRVDAHLASRDVSLVRSHTTDVGTAENKPELASDSPRRSSLHAPTASSHARDIAKADERMRRNARLRSRHSREGTPGARETSADVSPSPDALPYSGGLASVMTSVDFPSSRASFVTGFPPSLRDHGAVNAAIAFLGMNARVRLCVDTCARLAAVNFTVLWCSAASACAHAIL